ncbi:MAG: sulfur oxidation c-type cytochrome SoxA [Gammaproteobacteria bacterium]|nr:sulfur oxidation c-type cytochrome SoxA [Gammaproteobacteria bacterium]MCW8986420.1 sulfur oxidation c-type cytochrome SoxA [Gammaproteobacteria bacterium]
MKKIIIAATALLVGLAPMMAEASPRGDLKEFRDYFTKMNPGIKLQSYANGIYALDENRRVEWENIEEFPPYEDGVDAGARLFKKYGVAKCFPNGGKGIRQNYPMYKNGVVHTLEGDLMACLKKNGVDTKKEKLSYGKGKFAGIAAYMTSTSKGKATNVKIDPSRTSMAIYEQGKRHFYAKRGQLNFSCADCHIYNHGMMARGNLLSPALGQTSHFPVWRRSWASKTAAKNGKSGAFDGFGTIQRRYGGCNKQVRAKPLKGKDGKQHPEYVALEYFHTYMSNGIKINGPAVRQ